MFPELLLQDFDWQAWSRHVPPALRQPAAGASRLESIKWGLGPEPTGILSPGGHYGEQCESGDTADGCFVAKMMTHGRFSGRSSNISRAEVNFGEAPLALLPSFGQLATSTSAHAPVPTTQASTSPHRSTSSAVASRA